MRKFLAGIILPFAGSTWGAKIFKRIMHRLDKLVFKMTSDKQTMTKFVVGLPVAVITTTGAKSGLKRTMPLFYQHDPDNPSNIFLIASNFGSPKFPAWYHNMKANPTVIVTIDGVTGDFTATEIDEHDPRYAQFWQMASESYVGYENYKKRVTNRHIPVMLLEPQS